MTKLVLDIGAGGSSFVRSFKKLNPHIDAMYLCGEPEYTSVWDGKRRKGRIKKIRASYDFFNLPDNSLDMVTLNAFKLFLSPRIDNELARCLKSGGLFFSAHPVGIHPDLDGSLFATMEFGPLPVSGRGVTVIPKPSEIVRFGELPCWALFKQYGVQLHIDGIGEFVYPASPTNRSRIVWLRRPDRSRRVSDYIYEDRDGPPSLRVWVKL